MKTREYKPGEFCWVELVTTDTNSAKKFYTELLGWRYEENPIPDNGVYILGHYGDDVICGMCSQCDEEKNSKIPPHWNNYISVQSADQTVRDAQSLGAKIMDPPFDVMDVGRMAVIQDPTGPIFSIWQPKRHHGMSADSSEVGSFCWNECGTRGVVRAEDFYTKLFGWKLKHNSTGPMKYTEVSLDENPFAGMYEIPDDMKDVPPHWICYFTVDNCKERTEQVLKLGGKIFMAPTEIPEMGLISVIADPQGAVSGFYSAKK